MPSDKNLDDRDLFIVHANSDDYENAPDAIKPRKEVFEAIRSNIRTSYDKRGIRDATIEGAGLGGSAGVLLGIRNGHSRREKIVKAALGGLAGAFGGGALTRLTATRIVDSSHGINAKTGEISPTLQKVRATRDKRISGIALADMKATGRKFWGPADPNMEFNKARARMLKKFMKTKKKNNNIKEKMLFIDGDKVTVG